MKKISIQYSVFSLLFIFSYFLFPSSTEAKVPAFGGPLMLPSTVCTCPVPAVWMLVCDNKIGVPTPLLVLPGADINLNYQFIIPGTEILGTYTPVPGYCGVGTGPIGSPTCLPNPMALPPFTIGQLLPVIDTMGTGAIPNAPVCIPGGPATGGAAAGAAGAAGATGAAATDPLAPTDDFNTATDPSTAFPNGPGSTDYVNGLVNDNGLKVGSSGSSVGLLQNELRYGSGPAAQALNRALVTDPSAYGKYGRLTQAALNEYRNSATPANFYTGSGNLGSPTVRPPVTTPSNTTSNSSAAFINAYNNYLSISTPTLNSPNLGNSSNIGSAGASILNPGTSFNTGNIPSTNIISNPGANTNFNTGISQANNIVNGNTTNFNTGTTQTRPYSYIPTTREQELQKAIYEKNYVDNLINKNNLKVGSLDTAGNNGGSVGDLQNFLINKEGPAAKALADAIKNDFDNFGKFGSKTQAALDEFRGANSSFIDCDSCSLASSGNPNLKPGSYITQGSGEQISVDFDGSPGAYKVAYIAPEILESNGVRDRKGNLTAVQIMGEKYKLYNINGKQYVSVGSEDLANARRQSDGGWVGVVTDTGEPGGQPLIGNDGNLTGQLSIGALNGDTTPFIALSNHQVRQIKKQNNSFKLGDYLVVERTDVPVNSPNRYVTVKFADSSGGSRTNRNRIELSPAALNSLGISYNYRGVSATDDTVLKIHLPE